MKPLTAAEKLAKAKADLIFDFPFFATLIMQQPITEDAGIPTFATDGKSIRYNAKFLETLSVSEILFVLAHEVLHMCFEHMFRLENKDARTWNEAADYVINQVLVDEKVGSMPVGGLLNPDLVKQGEGTAEGVYSVLSRQQKQQQKEQNQGQQQAGHGPNQGQALDVLESPGQTAAESQQEKAENLKDWLRT
jgi:predicted metal-dependent peptidase